MTPPDIARLVIDRPADHVFDVHRDIFRDPEIFELEMKHIFEATWIFIGLESQVPKPHDFFTGWLGRQPIIVMRDGAGKIGCFLNSCRHRGAVVAHTAHGNTRSHVCNYHGWAYDSGGRCIAVSDHQDGCYAENFNQLDHGLRPVAKFASYRGILFASMNPDAPSLEEHLGDVRLFLDLILDQSEQGIEMIPGHSAVMFRANWKLQVENGLDVYHLAATHRSLNELVARRRSGESSHSLKTVDMNEFRKPNVIRGSYTFKRGHALVWGTMPRPEVRALYGVIDQVRKRVGDVRADWMIRARNLTIFPNLQLTDASSIQLRVIRPVAVDRTEMRIYCIAPVGESAEARTLRIRQFEDFFNSTGLAAPDDNAIYENMQIGFRAKSIDYHQGYGRGMTAVTRGPDELARALGANPETSFSGKYDIQDETVMHGGYREWLRLMHEGVSRAAP